LSSRPGEEAEGEGKGHAWKEKEKNIMDGLLMDY
jgi:hypothetical protein